MKKPHLTFWILSSFFLLIGLLNGIDFRKISSNNINIGDNIFMKTEHINIYPLIVVFLTVLGIIYWILKKVNIHLSNKLNLIHLVLTTIGIIFFAFPRILMKNINIIMENTMNLFFIGQLIFVINIVSGIVKRIQKPIANQIDDSPHN